MTTESDLLRSVLGDLLLEKGIPPWAHIFLEHQSDVYAILLRASCSCAVPSLDIRAVVVSDYHKPGCLLGKLLLASGGQLEIDRQNQAGLVEALEDPTYWKTRWTLAMSDIVGRLRRRDASLMECEVDSRPLRELIRAQVVRVQRPDGFLSLNPRMRPCGVCASVGPMPHYPGCPRILEVQQALTRRRVPIE